MGHLEGLGLGLELELGLGLGLGPYVTFFRVHIRTQFPLSRRLLTSLDL